MLLNALTKVIYSILRSKYDVKMAPRAGKKPVKKGKKKAARRGSSRASSSDEESESSAFELNGYHSSDSEF
jgi:hypothetical protein